MLADKNKELCTGCYACQNTCVKNCIRIVVDKSGFGYPNIDKDRCVNCGLCDNVCPTNKVFSNRDNFQTHAYAAYCLDDSVRINSSSGGIFSLIASSVQAKKGYICGAVYTYDNEVQHEISNSNIDPMRGSKYIQSCIGFEYKKIKKLLDGGEQVIFAGTPCQVAGLISMLGRQYDNLITLDCVCHGVPSKNLWDIYILYMEKKYKSKIKKINMRDKSTGWKEYSVKIEFQNGEIYQKRAENDYFMRLYLSNLFLRPSCYNCKFRGINRISDITIADLWGADRLVPHLDDDKGLSLVLLHTEKGRKIFESLKTKMKYEIVDIDKALECNPSVVLNSRIPSLTVQAQSDLRLLNMRRLVRKYARHKLSLYDIKVFIARILNHCCPIKAQVRNSPNNSN